MTTARLLYDHALARFVSNIHQVRRVATAVHDLADIGWIGSSRRTSGTMR